MQNIQLANLMMILLGIVMTISGPWIAVRTVQWEKNRRAENPAIRPDWFNSGFNLVIGVLLLLAGILFVVNNLRGNPFLGY